MKPDKPEEERMNPKLVMRLWMDLIQDLPGRYRPIVTALWNFSSDFFLKEDLITEDASFTTSRTSYRQIALFTGGVTQLKKKLKAMHELGFLDYDPDEHHPHGTIYTVYAKARQLAPHMLQSARNVKRAIKEIEAKFADPDYLKNADEPEEPEFDSELMVDPCAGDEEVRSGGRRPDSNESGQAVSDFGSGGFENQVRRFSPEGQADGVTTGFCSGFKATGIDELATASSDHHNSKTSQKPIDVESNVAANLQGAAPPLTPLTLPAKPGRIPVTRAATPAEELTHRQRQAAAREAHERYCRENPVEDIDV